MIAGIFCSCGRVWMLPSDNGPIEPMRYYDKGNRFVCVECEREDDEPLEPMDA